MSHARPIIILVSLLVLLATGVAADIGDATGQLTVTMTGRGKKVQIPLGGTLILKLPKSPSPPRGEGRRLAVLRH